MTATIHFYSELDRLEIECDKDEPIIWVRSHRTTDTVSLDLTKAEDRAQLRWALDQADAIADKGDTK